MVHPGSTASPGFGWPAPLVAARAALLKIDPRYSIAAFLGLYLILGFTVLEFNRGPTQALITTASCCGLEVFLHRLLKGKWIVPLSALITSLSLSILLNYSHDYFLLFVPVYFAIGSKYLFTFDDRHIFNPAQAGVTLSLLTMNELITAAPAYQWNGIASMSVFIVMLGLVFLVPQVRRGPLVASFLVTFTIVTAIRALVMRWHLPFETLFLGTLSSPSFFLFTFFMITDPATSPNDTKDQIRTGILLALIDLVLHLKQSYFTFFYAAFILASSHLLIRHARAAWASGSIGSYLGDRFYRSGYWRRPTLVLGLGAAGVGLYGLVLEPKLTVGKVDFAMVRIDPAQSGIQPQLGDTLTRVDRRLHHIAKWILSVGDAVASGDYDGDGLTDLFFTFPIKRDGDRAVLYRNLGGFKFERVPLPIDAESVAIEEFGFPSCGLFVDYDSDGDLDLYVLRASGYPRLLQNRLIEDGAATFVDVSKAAGIDRYGNAIGANFFDVDGDGRLDLYVGQVLPDHLAGYDTPTRLDLFRLPEPAFAGDERMFDFMHASWHQADNGGVNDLYLQDAGGHFIRQDPIAFGMPETRWSLAIGTGDLDHDGDTDLYVANDFGPDDLYFNEGGRRLSNFKGSFFGSVGRDTYKGMNASVADLDRNGWLDVYVSNVHHALQAEGSLLWMFGPGDNGRPTIVDRATQLGALNEQRFGWGASLTDFDGDGWVDIAQANGMVDDTPDKRFEECPDYWYVNEKIARSPPSIHGKANRWGDIRGFCIYGNELNRLYLNRGDGKERRFADVATLVGMTEATNSRGMAAVDLDNDGRRDLVVTHQFAPPTIYRNQLATGAVAPHFIGFQLVGDGVRCNRSAIGSTVRILGPVTQMREAQVATGFSSQDDPRIHFGLGADSAPVEVEVDWCGQGRQRYSGLAIDRYHRLVR